MKTTDSFLHHQIPKEEQGPWLVMLNLNLSASHLEKLFLASQVLTQMLNSLLLGLQLTALLPLHGLELLSLVLKLCLQLLYHSTQLLQGKSIHLGSQSSQTCKQQATGSVEK